jgi:hypothetical protein
MSKPLYEDVKIEPKERKHLIERAIATLKDDHVQTNKSRMGLLGSMSIDSAIEDLENALKSERNQFII